MQRQNPARALLFGQAQKGNPRLKVLHTVARSSVEVRNHFGRRWTSFGPRRAELCPADKRLGSIPSPCRPPVPSPAPRARPGTPLQGDRDVPASPVGSLNPEPKAPQPETRPRHPPSPSASPFRTWSAASADTTLPTCPRIPSLCRYKGAGTVVTLEGFVELQSCARCSATSSKRTAAHDCLGSCRGLATGPKAQRGLQTPLHPLIGAGQPPV